MIDLLAVSIAATNRFSALSRSCIKQHIPEEDTIGREVQALVQERNTAQSLINWRFRTQHTRARLNSLYPYHILT